MDNLKNYDVATDGAPALHSLTRKKKSYKGPDHTYAKLAGFFNSTDT
jgi:hypothetical protein